MVETPQQSWMASPHSVLCASLHKDSMKLKDCAIQELSNEEHLEPGVWLPASKAPVFRSSIDGLHQNYGAERGLPLALQSD